MRSQLPIPTPPSGALGLLVLGYLVRLAKASGRRRAGSCQGQGVGATQKGSVVGKYDPPAWFRGEGGFAAQDDNGKAGIGLNIEP